MSFLTIATKQRDQDELAHLAQALGLESSVQIREGQSVSAIEAMAAGAE